MVQEGNLGSEEDAGCCSRCWKGKNVKFNCLFPNLIIPEDFILLGKREKTLTQALL